MQGCDRQRAHLRAPELKELKCADYQGRGPGTHRLQLPAENSSSDGTVRASAPAVWPSRDSDEDKKRGEREGNDVP